ncbi:hypothetical protein NESM_000162300 [Novymonas esmeraldas]|uniref:Transmembrane protein n=1 Tax=Novymonas esmeraldas TaxID=1808958 RepID=A0AAW0F6M1_9TRYP
MLHRSIVEDTAPPQPRAARPLKPQIVYLNQSVSATATRAVNATKDAVNRTLSAASSYLASAATHTTSDAAAAESNITAARSTTDAPFTEDLNKMTTTSLSERVSQLSLVHLLAWFLLFATMSVTTVVLLNWCMRSRQSSADAAGDDGDDEEMPGKAGVPSSWSVQSSHTEGPSSATSSSSRLLASRGNLARQQFLESRKTGSAPKDYGGTSLTSSR